MSVHSHVTCVSLSFRLNLFPTLPCLTQITRRRHTCHGTFSVHSFSPSSASRRTLLPSRHPSVSLSSSSQPNPQKRTDHPYRNDPMGSTSSPVSEDGQCRIECTRGGTFRRGKNTELRQGEVLPGRKSDSKKPTEPSESIVVEVTRTGKGKY